MMLGTTPVLEPWPLYARMNHEPVNGGHLDLTRPFRCTLVAFHLRFDQDLFVACRACPLDKRYSHEYI